MATLLLSKSEKINFYEGSSKSFNMDLRSDLLAKLSTSMNLLHLEVENWIIFQRSTFDYYDEGGDPFVCQIFLIEISTGRYIHRSQGQKVEQGTSLDVDVLTTKLTQVFQGSKPCLGVPIENEGQPSKDWIISDYPFRRSVSLECQFYYENPQIKAEPGQESELISRCGPCQKSWNEVQSRSNRSKEISVRFNLRSSKVDQMKFEYEGSNDEDSMDADYEVFGNDEDDIWSPPGHISVEFMPSSSGTGPVKTREYICICCSKPFPTIYDLAKHRNQSQKKDQSRPKTRTRKREIALKSKKGSKLPKTKVDDDDDGSESDNQPPRTPQIGKLGQLPRCTCCSKEFASYKELGEHRRKNDQEERARRKVGCLECDKPSITTFPNLIKHASVMHPERLDEFQAYFPKDPDLEMMKEPKKCSTCDMVSNGRSMYVRHKHNYHSVGDYPCETCQEPCLTYYDLVIHNYQKHKKPMDLIPPDYVGAKATVDEDGKISYKMSKLTCRFCSGAYKSSSSYFNHLRRIHSWGNIRCRPCGGMGHSAKGITSHVLHFHKDNPEVKCPNCQQIFDLKDDPKKFENHFSKCPSNLNNKGPFQCQYCGKEYAFKLSLSAHLKMHQGIIRFKCQYCEFGSNLKHVFDVHEKMHLRKMGLLIEEPEEDHLRQCQICGKQLTNSKQVAQHIRVVHQRRKQTFQCKKCGEFFPYSAALGKHKIEVHGHVPRSMKD